MAAENFDDRLVWLDCEMSGLDHEKEKLLEVAVAVTDGNLENFVMGPTCVIHQSPIVLNNMDDWNKKHHNESGLIEKVKQSKLTELQAEEQILMFLEEQHIPEGKCPLAGNSVYQDKLFLLKAMPRFMKYTHYRLVDVSTIKELAKRWYPDTVLSKPKKKDNHRAKDDIQDSIDELKFYKSSVFMQKHV